MCGPLPATPEFALKDFVTFTTALLVVTVVVFVLLAAAAGEAVAVPVAVTIIFAISPEVAAPPTMPTATNLKVEPAANSPELVMAEALSGTPSPFASA